jgi:hypothetical protein
MLILWLLVQAAALGLAAARVPLSAHFPQPAERQAMAEMLIAQIAAAAVLFPLLLQDWTAFGLAEAASWPMLDLAALLGGQPPARIAWAAGYVTLWLATLTLWQKILGQSPWQRLAVGLASLWTLGGPVLLYLHGEYASGGRIWPPENSPAIWAAAGGPIWAGLARLNGARLFQGADLPLLLLLACGILLNLLRFFQSPRSSDRLSTSSA